MLRPGGRVGRPPTPTSAVLACLCPRDRASTAPATAKLVPPKALHHDAIIGSGPLLRRRPPQGRRLRRVPSKRPHAPGGHRLLGTCGEGIALTRTSRCGGRTPRSFEPLVPGQEGRPPDGAHRRGRDPPARAKRTSRPPVGRSSSRTPGGSAPPATAGRPGRRPATAPP